MNKLKRKFRVIVSGYKLDSIHETKEGAEKRIAELQAQGYVAYWKFEKRSIK